MKVLIVSTRSFSDRFIRLHENEKGDWKRWFHIINHPERSSPNYAQITTKSPKRHKKDSQAGIQDIAEFPIHSYVRH